MCLFFRFLSPISSVSTTVPFAAAITERTFASPLAAFASSTQAAYHGRSSSAVTSHRTNSCVGFLAEDLDVGLGNWDMTDSAAAWLRPIMMRPIMMRCDDVHWNDYPEVWPIERKTILMTFDNPKYFRLDTDDGRAEWAAIAPTNDPSPSRWCTNWSALISSTREWSRITQKETQIHHSRWGTAWTMCGKWLCAMGIWSSSRSNLLRMKIWLAWGL